MDECTRLQATRPLSAPSLLSTPNRAILDLMYYRTQLGRKVDELLRVFCNP